MQTSRLRLAITALAGGIALSGCAYGMYGDGYGSYGGVSVGIGSGYGYGGYGYGGYGYDGYGYGYDPFGWYGDYYYPGVGFYVYDRHHNRHQWTDEQRRYWEQRRSQWQNHHSGTTGATGTTATTGTSENWSGWDRSRWRNRSSGSTDGNWSRPNRGSSQNRSPATTQSSDRSPPPSPRRSRDHADERPQ
jgi:hypothetical protein